MASGKNHDRSIYFATPIVGIIAGSYSLELGLIAASSHLLGGLYLSPDLDLKSIPWKRWGLLKFIWLPYQKFIPHRHWLSHAPVVGSIGRLLYLGVLLSPVAIVLMRELQPLQLGKEFWHSVAAALVGVEVSALNHLLLDGLLIPLPKAFKARLRGN
jgi:uncharacterized metal-binding protein